METLRLLVTAALLAHSIVDASKHTSLEEPFQSSFKNLIHSPCVTLFYRNGRSGCGTVDRGDQSGPLFYFDGSESPPYGRSFVAVIEEYQLSSEVMNEILKTNSNGNVKGILVLNSTSVNDENKYTSPGPMYPSGYSTPNAGVSYGNINYPWNNNGDGLTQYDLYGIPMAYVNEYETSQYIRNSAQDENKKVQIYTNFNYYMGPDQTNSLECLAWKDDHDGKWNPKCLPLGGTSVWAFAGSPPKNNNARKLEDANNNQKPAIVLGTSVDSTSMFHDLVPGANEGASNTLTLLMAAYLLGQSTNDATLDALPNRIVFGFFEGEAYGYIGSRSFFNDVLNFACEDEYTAYSVSKDDKSDKACLYPMRPSLRFQDIGQIAGVLAVDQIGVPSGEGNLYVHNDGNDGMGAFLANVLQYSGTDYYTAVASEAGDQGNGDEFPYPPTPFTALQALTNGAYGGAVLSGYDIGFPKRPPYQSHLNWVDYSEMNLKAIASAATMLARAALAAAYDDGSYDYETSAKYAANAISELSYDDELLVDLADCLFVDGNCKLLSKYSSMDAKNERSRTGLEISSGQSLGMPPNYYVGVYNYEYGQPYVRVGDNYYGSYNGENYGKKSTDTVAMQPKMLQQALRNMLNDFLGQGSVNSQNGSAANHRSCKSRSDCDGVSYCGNSGDSATCAASKKCVCERAFYHVALDEAFTATAGKFPGYFDISEDDNGVSPAWTEPYWSSDVGIKMYHVSNTSPGFVSLAFGAIVLGACFFITVIVKVGMKKEKVY